MIPHYTIEEYLHLERAAEDRRQYLDGRILPISGESLEHSRICVNLAVEMGTQLRGKPCEVMSQNIKLLSGAVGKQPIMISYADLVVACGEPLFYDENKDVLLNPKVIIEVLSPATEAFDRGEKFLRYRKGVDSLTDYLMVTQTRPLIDHYVRRPEGWLLSEFSEPADTVLLSSIGCQLHLADVYNRIAFASTGG